MMRGRRLKTEHVKYGTDGGGTEGRTERRTRIHAAGPITGPRFPGYGCFPSAAASTGPSHPELKGGVSCTDISGAKTGLRRM